VIFGNKPDFERGQALGKGRGAKTLKGFSFEFQLLLKLMQCITKKLVMQEGDLTICCKWSSRVKKPRNWFFSQAASVELTTQAIKLA